MEYSVVVGNVGYVYIGADPNAARQCYDEYVMQSENGCGRAAGEPVAFCVDGEPELEHYGQNEDEEAALDCR